MTSETHDETAAPTPHRPIALAPVTLTAIVAAVLMVGYNATYWSKGTEIFAGHPLQLVLLNFAMFCVTCAFFAFFSFRLTVRPFLAAMVIVTAVTSFYMDTLGVIIDREMIQNVATTTFTEGKHLLTPQFAIHVAIFGLLPALAVLFVPLRRQGWVATVGGPVALFSVGMVLALGITMLNFKSYSAVAREHKDLMASYQPGAPIVGAVRYAKMMTASARRPLEAIGMDAHQVNRGAGRKPTLTVVVAGETARAANFGLNGYAVDTTPELAKRDVVNFTHVTSCGTATATSLPCMFSKYTREEYSYDKGVSTESLLDVLTHAGIETEWWDNQTGHKGVAERVPHETFTNSDNAEFCPTGECTDGIFLQHLEEFVPKVSRDTVLVLHQIGSHGPTYYLRHPADLAPFQPECETAEFKDCTPDEIRNAYDNSIFYTDRVLSDTIDLLAAQTGLATSLIYVSDHGESLGEGGLYLHGAPYFMAPEDQTHVPMVLWMSEDFAAQGGIDRSCVEDKSDAALSHDYLFHTVLGMMDVETEVRQPALDLLADCHTADLSARR